MRKILAAALLGATANLALGPGIAVADATANVSHHARFCSAEQNGNTVAFQVNDGKASDYSGDTPPEDTWRGQWSTNITFDTWVERIPHQPNGRGMWCHTVVRSDLKEGDWVRLSQWHPSASTAVQLTEVVELNGAVAQRLIAGPGWFAATGRCCSASFTTIPAPSIPDPVEPEPVDPIPPGGGGSSPFGSS